MMTIGNIQIRNLFKMFLQPVDFTLGINFPQRMFFFVRGGKFINRFRFFSQSDESIDFDTVRVSNQHRFGIEFRLMQIIFEEFHTILQRVFVFFDNILLIILNRCSGYDSGESLHFCLNFIKIKNRFFFGNKNVFLFKILIFKRYSFKTLVRRNFLQMCISRIDHMQKRIRIKIQPCSKLSRTVIVIRSAGYQCYFICNGTNRFKRNYFGHSIN